MPKTKETDSGPPQVAIDDIVKVIVLDGPLTIGWDGKEYPLSPGQERFVPAAAAFCWFGDPRSTENVRSVRDEQDVVSFIPDRATEVRRLRCKYGLSMGDEASFDHPDNDDMRVPEVEVYTIEGDRVITVLEDPAGDNINVAVRSVSEDVDLRDQIARLQRQMAMLEAADEMTEQASQESELPTDEGSGVPKLQSTKKAPAPRLKPNLPPADEE